MEKQQVSMRVFRLSSFRCLAVEAKAHLMKIKLRQRRRSSRNKEGGEDMVVENNAQRCATPSLSGVRRWALVDVSMKAILKPLGRGQVVH